MPPGTQRTLGAATGSVLQLIVVSPRAACTTRAPATNTNSLQVTQLGFLRVKRVRGEVASGLGFVR